MTKGIIDKKFLDKNGNLLPELKKFNWGAFFLPWIWGIFNKTFITLIALLVQFIPIINFFGIFLCIWFGIKGNEWALKNKEWKSVEHFQKVQKRWAIGGLIIFFIAVVGLITSMVISVLLLDTNQKIYKVSFNSAANTLQNAINAEGANIDMSSGESLAAVIAKNMPEKYMPNLNGNKIDTYGGSMVYIFDCQTSTKCIITVDANGIKAPNELTKSASKLKDRAEFILVKKEDNKYKLKKPEWLNKTSK